MPVDILKAYVSTLRDSLCGNDRDAKDESADAEKQRDIFYLVNDIMRNKPLQSEQNTVSNLIISADITKMFSFFGAEIIRRRTLVEDGHY